MPDSSKICIIGPDPAREYCGGVATHVRNLMKLPALRNATVFDLGSLETPNKLAVIPIFLRLLTLRSAVKKGAFSLLLVNASIYNSALLKALLTVLVLPRTNCLGTVRIHIYFHGGNFDSISSYIASAGKLLSFTLLKKVTAFHFLTAQQKKGFDGAFSSLNSRLFSNYSDSDALLPRRHSAARVTKILFVGRIVRAKGIFELLEAFEKLRKTYSGSVELTFAGAGEDIDELKARAGDLPPGAVSFAGFLNQGQLEQVYSTSDLLVLPSYAEAFPYVVIEALRAGLPIVSTPVGALNDLVLDGVTGFKVAVRDPDSIVRAIDKVLSDRSLWQDMSKNCQQFFQDTLSSSAAERYYSAICSGSGE